MGTELAGPLLRIPWVYSVEFSGGTHTLHDSLRAGRPRD